MTTFFNYKNKFMKKMLFNILISSVLILSNACKKEEPIEPEPVPSTPLIWTFDTKLTGLATNNFIYKNMIIQGVANNSGSNTTKVWALTLDSGKVVWETQELPFIDAFDPESSLLIEDKLVFMSYNKLVVLLAETGTILWDITLATQRTRRISHLGNFVYISTAGSSSFDARIYKFDLNDGTLETLFTLPVSADGFTPKLTAPNFWTHPNGDKIMVMANQAENIASVHSYDFIAYNLSADSLLWYKKGRHDEKGSILSPYVHNNLAIFYVERTVEAVDMLSGKAVWTHTRHPSDDYSAYKTANITAWNNILIAKPDSDYMYGLNINTGQEIWANKNTASMPFATRIAMDKIWYSSGGVNCIDASSGKTIIDRWRYKDKGSWINSIAVDENEKKGYIYTIANGSIFCFDSKLLMKK